MRGVPHLNIGTEKSCLFVYLSKHLIGVLKRNPLLYYAVEESLTCAERGYYSAGILTFSQMLNQFNGKTPSARHEIAHEFLQKRPTKKTYESILEQLKLAMEIKYIAGKRFASRRSAQEERHLPVCHGMFV